MSREGKPMGVLVVMCYEAKRYQKPRSNEAETPSVPHASRDQAVRSTTKSQQAEAKSAPPQTVSAQEVNEDVDEGWLALVA